MLLSKICGAGGERMDYEDLRLFGLDFRKEKLETKGLPLYLTAGRDFFKLSYAGQQFALVRVYDDERFGVIALEKQAAQLTEKFGMLVAFEFPSVTKSQRDSLTERNIPFIAGSDQVYLPFLGIALCNHFTLAKSVKAEKMMPVTQTLFLWLLYQCGEKMVMKKDAAEKIGVTRTSLTRASEQLASMGLISQRKAGKEILMKAEGSGIELYRKAKPFLINPVQRTITVQNNGKYDDYPLSGESALAKNTMLNDPRIPVRAVWKASIHADMIRELDIRWEPDADPVKLELWKYDPALFAKGGAVDPVSAAMSFENNADERIEGAIEEYLEGYSWYLNSMYQV